MDERRVPLRLSRRTFIRLSAMAGTLGATSLLLEACQRAAGPTPAGTPSGVTTPTQPPSAMVSPTIAVTPTRERAAGPLIIAGWGGRFTQASRTYLAEPFSAETGIEVQFVDAPSEQLARILAQRDAGKIEWDLVDSASAVDAYVAFNRGLAAELPDELKAKFKEILNVANDWGFAYSALGHVVVCREDEAQACPATPVELWDVERFPGPRSFSSFNTLEVLTMALLADGVPKDQLFPMDVDRAFAKMEAIKPNVAVWWSSGDQSEQVLRDAEAVMGQFWSGRAYNVLDQGVALHISWEQGVYEPGFWFALDGAPHLETAFQFLDWIATHPEAQAKWATEMRYGVANPKAFDYMDEAVAKRLADYPDNFKKLVVPNWQWYAENFDAIQKRWTEFLAQ